MSDDGGGNGDGDEGGGGTVSTGRVVALLVLGVPILAAGAHGAVVQDQQISGAERTQGTVVVLSSNFDVDRTGRVAPDRGSSARDPASSAVRNAPAEPVAASQYGSSPRAGRDRFVFQVTYRYAVDGRNYTSSVVYPVQVQETLPAATTRFLWWADARTLTTDDVGTARSYATRYREGSTITVYYGPDSPGDAFIVDRYSSSSYAFLLLGLVVGLPGLAGGHKLLARRQFGDYNAAGGPVARILLGLGAFPAPAVHLLLTSGETLRAGAALVVSVVASLVAVLLYVWAATPLE